MFKTGIDLGYGYVKGVNELGKQMLFPSLVAGGYQRNLTGLFGNDGGNLLKNMHVVLHDSQGSEEYFVGDLAGREGTNVSYAFDEDKINHPNTRALLATTAAYLGPEAEEPIHVVTGLPLEQYIHQREKFKEMIENLKVMVTFKGFDTLKVVKFEKVTIFPQGAGAVYCAIMDNLQKYLVKGSYLGLIDLGYRTTDYIVFYVDGKLTLREDLSGTLDMGMSALNNAADKFFTQKTGSKLDTTELLRLVQDREIFYKGEMMSFKKELQMTKRELARVIKDRIKARWGNKLDFFNTVFLAGGGAKSIYEGMKDIHENTQLVKNAQMANAQGFLNVAMLEEKK